MLWLRAHLKEGNTVTPKRVNRGIMPWNPEMAKSHPENPHPQTMKSWTPTRPTNWISTWNLSHIKLKMPARCRSLVMQDQPRWSANSFSYCGPRNDSSFLVRTKLSLPLHHFSYTCSHAKTCAQPSPGLETHIGHIPDLAMDWLLLHPFVVGATSGISCSLITAASTYCQSSQPAMWLPPGVLKLLLCGIPGCPKHILQNLLGFLQGHLYFKEAHLASSDC